MRATAERLAQPEPLGRYIVMDEQGHALRATWRPAHGFVNLSIWRDDTCVETFHLTPTDASNLVGFLVAAFAASVPPPARPTLKAVSSSPAPTAPSRRFRHRVASELDRLARSLRR